MKYEVYYYDICTDESGTLLRTDSPEKALVKFFAEQKSHPISIAIMANLLVDARHLIEYAYTHKDKIDWCYDRYEKIPYKRDFIKEEIDKAYLKNKYNDPTDPTKSYMDQVYPFALG